MRDTTILASLFQKATRTLTQNDETWRGFLDTFGRYYKRSLSATVLIHIQNPNALLFGLEKDWKVVGRKLHPEAQSIAVLNTEGTETQIEYFFDISQTTGSNVSYEKVLRNLWRVEEENKAPLMSYLNDKYHLNHFSLEQAIWEIIKERVKNYSVLNVLDEQQTTLLESSIYYLVGSRCNLKFGLPHFKGLQSCQSVENFINIGENIADIVRPLLQEIGHEIGEIERSKAHGQPIQPE
ncbi:MAG: hypothetical protein R3Y63_04745 [Eubacteriales bacterium]